MLSNLTWHEAQAVCRFLDARLPTEAEWAAAARGAQGRRFPWGDQVPCGLGTPEDRFAARPRDAWQTIPGCEDVQDPMSPRQPSPDNVRDLAWGHWEWVADDLGDGARVQRGGAWTAEDGTGVRSATRVVTPGHTRTFDVGVRCAW
jgi:formylglycine-generating enzyme required for sulfatase activity